MTLLALLLIALVLFVGFLLLTVREAQTGTRLFASVRENLDTKLSKADAHLKERPLSEIARGTLWSFTRHFLQETAHVALATVRVIERALSRLVHRLQRPAPVRSEEEGKI